MDVGERLSLDVRRDFTFLHPEVLDAKCTVDGPTLRLNNRVNHEQYRVVRHSRLAGDPREQPGEDQRLLRAGRRGDRHDAVARALGRSR